MSGPEEVKAEVRVLPASAGGVASLVWSGDRLIDWVSGGVEYGLGGTVERATVCYSYRFDAACASPSGFPAAIYERLGTKAVLIKEDHFLIREVDRSFYHADVYEYPIALFRLSDGREVLAHCPEDYCDLVVDDARTGARLSLPGGGREQSLFHSRLAVNPAGTRLLSAGWVWHPFDVVVVYDLKPEADGRLSLVRCDACCACDDEVAAAAFTPSGRLVVTCAKGADDSLRDEPGQGLRAGMIGVYDLDEQRLVSSARLEDEAGTLMPVGEGHVVGFFDHPKLIELATGRTLARWPELKTGRQKSSIHGYQPDPLPPVALDPAGGRFAVADGKTITVVTLPRQPGGEP